MCFGIILVMMILMNQEHLPLNPRKLPSVPFALALNMGISYVTNTNWQNYAPEVTLSPFAQMTAMTVQNFISPAIGLCMCATLVRGVAAKTLGFLGNFWVDITRVTYYLFLPLAMVVAIVFLWQGVPQNFQNKVEITTLEQAHQSIIQGPIASQEAIKILGTNGGGYTNTNSAHPYENPSFYSNTLQIFLMILIPSAQIYYFGLSIQNTRHAWNLFTAVAMVFAAGVLTLNWAEMNQNPLFNFLSIDPTQGNMEGKELRNSILGSTFFTVTSHFCSNGAVNSSIDSYSPLGSLVALICLQLNEAVFGGVGSGLHTIIILSILSTYLAGLMSGKKPEYLGKPVSIYDIKMSMLSLFIYIFMILSLAAIALTSTWGTSVTLNAGPHGFTEILYSISSSSANNGNNILGTAINTPEFNWLTSVSMLVHRVSVMTFVILIANSARKKRSFGPSKPSLEINSLTFIFLFLAILFILGALSYLPSLILGPILEHLLMNQGTLF